MPLESVDSRYALPDDQRVHIVRALVSFHRLEIHQVTHDWVVIGHTVGAQNIAREAGAFQRHPDVIPLRHRDVLWFDFACVFQPAYLQHQQLSFGDLADHPRQLVLNELVGGDRLIAPLFAQK